MKDLELLKKELAQTKNVKDLQPEVEQLKAQLEKITLELKDEKHKHLKDIESRFKRCLEIL